MSIASNIYRLDSMVFIRHCVFTKYLKFRVNPEKIVNSIFHSDTGASIEEFRKISSGYELGCPLPPIFIDWTRWYSSDTLFSVSYTHLRAHETDSYLVCRLLL